MIVKHKSLARSIKIMNSLEQAVKVNGTIDGVIETFKKDDKQGLVLKIYDTYDKNQDTCIWVYEDINRKKIVTLIGSHNCCDKYNFYNNDVSVFREYQVISKVVQDIVKDIVNLIYKEYDMKIKI